MSLQRKAIRQALKDALLNKTDCGARVYTNRVLPVWNSNLPAILIYTQSETREVYNDAPRLMKSNLHVSIEIIADGLSDIDDTLDILGSQVEYELNQDHILGDLCEDVIQESCEQTINEQGEKFVGSSVLTYSVPYYAEAVRDAQFLDKLETTHAEWQLEDSPSSVEAEDLVTGYWE
jgi:hypothetical protein